MKYIMLPIHSNWVCSIMNGIKEIEVRSGTRLYNAINRLIDEQGKAPCLMYCTKANSKNPYLAKEWGESDCWDKCSLGGYGYSTSFAKEDFDEDSEILNGKVVAEFEASAEEIFSEGLENGCGGYNYFFYTEEINDILKKSCLDEFELREYLGEKRGGEVVGTAIHIHKLKLLDKPKKLADYGVKCSPQSFMYVEVDE